MITEQSIIDFFKQYNFDVRISHNGRWIDQKCTPDVLSFVADCIVNYINESQENLSFTSKQIQFSDYAEETILLIYKKPNPKADKAKHEYDKFFQQPMKLLANANILSEEKIKGKNVFTVLNKEILEYISIREKNSFIFLVRYFEKVLSDSDLYHSFQTFFHMQKFISKNDTMQKDEYKKLKDEFEKFLHTYTKIKESYEPKRIFTKVINILACFYNLKGTKGGHLSKNIITFDSLMYNSENFRDIYANKPKGITRKEYSTTHIPKVNEKYYDYQSDKAKRYLRKFNDQFRKGTTEHLDGTNTNVNATQIHHIFPKALFPEICHYLENLIALTPNQHFSFAHPNNNTQEISVEYQHLLLLSKADRIKENIEDSYSDKVERIYEFPRFLHILSVGFDDDDVEEIDNMDWVSVMNAINVHYSKIA